MDSKITKKLTQLERQAGSKAPLIFLIENGKITSAGKEYTREQYERIKAGNRDCITLIDDIPRT